MQDRARQQEDAKNSILSQIMDQDARARCKSAHPLNEPFVKQRKNMKSHHCSSDKGSYLFFCLFRFLLIKIVQ